MFIADLWDMGISMQTSFPSHRSACPRPSWTSTFQPEFFGSQKISSLLATALKSLVHDVFPLIKFDKTPYFDSVQQIIKLYAKGVDLGSTILESGDPKRISNRLVFVNTLLHPEGADKCILKYPLPQVVAADNNAWTTDEEFGRQTLAGMNPGIIRSLQEFPPKSGLDQAEYGKGTALKVEDIEPFMQGVTVDQAIRDKRLFIIDYHDAFLPYLKEVNKDKKKKAYAPRAIFFLTNEEKMVPVAIELSLPPPKASNRVFTPKHPLWLVAKAHFSALDLTFHEVISHWLRTHAVMEPFILATRRQLSALHPIYQLLYPLARGTLMINAAARSSLINANGIIETEFSFGGYAIQISSEWYGSSWRFDQQGLPQDLVARGMAERADDSYPGGVKLVVDDYPFAKDGLEIYGAMKDWISDYVNIAYKGKDAAVRNDSELQAWWKEIVETGHGDKKEGWIQPDCIENLVEILTILHWIPGPGHAAVNFSQYAYGGFVPNKSSMCVRLIPEEGTPEYVEAVRDPMKCLLTTIAPEADALKGMLVLELLSTHAEDEEYIGSRDKMWTSDPRVQAAFAKYAAKIEEAEKRFAARNSDPKLVNRSGPAKVPYTLMYPHSTPGLTGRGIPNSISI